MSSLEAKKELMLAKRLVEARQSGDNKKSSKKNKSETGGLISYDAHNDQVRIYS